jgi:hypothetical protein
MLISNEHFKNAGGVHINLSDHEKVTLLRMHGLSSHPHVIVADCIHIPIKDHSVDADHLSTVERRIRCLEELSRIVRTGGLINVQAWAKEQEEGDI